MPALLSALSCTARGPLGQMANINFISRPRENIEDGKDPTGLARPQVLLEPLFR